MAEATVAEPVATEAMAIYCFDALVEHFTGKASPPPLFDEAHCPLFVTWMKGPADRQRLRGCIGTLQPRYIRQGLKDYALTSALRDHRFNAVQWSEVPSLECTVSLLTNYEDADHYLDWEVGRHGLIIEFNDPDAKIIRNATYLPEIAEREGWTHEETIESLVRKAGFNGVLTVKFKQSIKVTRYQSSLCTMRYEQYLVAVGERDA